MKDKLPTTIVIPAEAYRYGLNQLIQELWDEKAFDRLQTLCESAAEPELTVDLLRWRNRASKRLFRLPFWRRADCIARWPAEEQLSMFANIRAAHDAPGPRDLLLRASARRLLGWIEGRVKPVDPMKNEVQPIVLGLALTRNYAEWLSHGGDADVGRYLGCWAERFWMSENQAST